MSLVVDDHALLEILSDSHTGWLRAEVEQSPVHTTAAWYWRLANAAHRGTGEGALSRRLRTLSPPVRERTLAHLDRLPPEIGLVGPRLLVPVMARLDVSRRPNGLAAEALAVALVTDSTIAVSIDTPLIREGAADLNLGYRLIA